jgi:DNA-directed RNA polymerase specialized sigma24 family protein
VSLPAFQTLLDAHGRDVHRFLVGLVGPHAAEDCYQETWLAALRAYPALREAGNLRGWIFTIAQRKALDHHRRAGREALPVAELPVGAGDASEGCKVTAADGGGELWGRVRALPGKQRGAVAMRYLLGYGYEEIAVALDCSQEAARRSAHEGIKRLRREYDDGSG